MASGDTKTNQYLDIAANGSRADLPSDTCCETRAQTLIRGVAERIMDVEDEVERLENNPDVADIVATYADLQAYDTSQLTDKDIIRVLQDETRDGDSTYYRWSTATETWTYVGESKQYTDFTGTDGTTAGTAGLVPAPATTDADKYLKSDGTWAEVQGGGGGPTVVQTTGTSTTDVMSQNAVTSMVFADPGTGRQIKIGNSTNAGGTNSVAIGPLSNASSNAPDGVAIGLASNASRRGAIAIGSHSVASAIGEMNIGSSVTTDGYNNSKYRLLTGVYDGQSSHDAATVGQITPTTDSSAPTTATAGRLGEIRIDTTTNTAYMCVLSDSTTPAYEWKQITA